MVVDSNDSGIFSLASVGSYLDALSSITGEMSLRDRSNLIFIDKCLHDQWGLGQNVILNWSIEPEGLGLLVIPHYAVAEFSERLQADGGSDGRSEGFASRPSEEFLRELLSRERHLSQAQMQKVGRLLGIEKTMIGLRSPVPRGSAQVRIIENMIRRYSINYVPSRAVALFDIVGFSLLSPFEQMNQLNSLSYSLNAAQSKLLSKRIGINFARSTTGDGFYIWNRDLTLEANINLYHFMHLVLADNAIAQSKSRHPNVPQLRACFHVGSCYEFYQSEGLNPSLYNYIVGDVTVELARMIERALPGQILVGEFHAELRSAPPPGERYVKLGSIDFVATAKESLAQLQGLELSGERVDAIKCYLTGAALGNGEFSIRRIVVNDKHGISRHVFNAKINIYRRHAAPIYLGIEDQFIDRNSEPRSALHPVQRLAAPYRL